MTGRLARRFCTVGAGAFRRSQPASIAQYQVGQGGAIRTRQRRAVYSRVRAPCSGSPGVEVGMDFREIGKHLPRTKWGVGWVEKRGKRRKVWVGFWYDYVLMGDSERRRVREKVL